MLTLGGEKMSKSLGNTLLVSEIVTKWRPVEVRYYLGSAHYRSRMEYSTEALDEAAAAYSPDRELRRARCGASGRGSATSRRCRRSSWPPWTMTWACRRHSR